MRQLVAALGTGYAAHLCSYAGHGTTEDAVNVEKHIDYYKKHRNHTTTANHNDDTAYQYHHQQKQRDLRIPWTINGQVLHKMEWVLGLLKQYKNKSQQSNNHQSHHHDESSSSSSSSSKRTLSPTRPRLIFCSHSIGSHMVNRMLMLSPNLLLRSTDLVLHWMPFIRMDAPWFQQIRLDTAAHHPTMAVGVVKTALRFFHNMAGKDEDTMNHWLEQTVPDEEGRELTVQLLKHSTFGRNFLELGTEEIREVPVVPDLPAIRHITQHCPVAMAFCANDHWAPRQHMRDLEQLFPKNNLTIEYFPQLQHDFVVHPVMIPKIFQFSLQQIQKRHRLDGKL